MIACKVCKVEFRSFRSLTVHLDMLAEQHKLRREAGLKVTTKLIAHRDLAVELVDVEERSSRDSW